MATIKALGPVTSITTTTNQFTNPSFETGLTGLIAGAEVASVVQTTNGFGRASGTYGLEITGAASTTSVLSSRLEQAVGAVSPGQWVAFAARVRKRNENAPYVGLDVNWTGAGSRADTWSALSVASLSDPTAPTRVVTAVQAPAGATAATARMFFGSTIGGGIPGPNWAAHSDAWVSAIADTEAEALAAVAAYFDGDSEGAHWLGAANASASALDYVIAPLLILDYGFTRGSRNVILEPLGSKYPHVFLRDAQSRSGTLTMLFGSAVAANDADTVLSSANRFHFQELEAAQDFHFIRSGSVSVEKVVGMNYWTVAVEFREVEPL